MTLKQKRQSLQRGLEALAEFHNNNPCNQSPGKDIMALFASRYIRMHHDGIQDMLGNDNTPEQILDGAMHYMANIMMVIESIISDLQRQEAEKKALLN